MKFFQNFVWANSGTKKNILNGWLTLNRTLKRRVRKDALNITWLKDNNKNKIIYSELKYP